MEFELLPIRNEENNVDLLYLAENLSSDVAFKMLVSFTYGRCCTDIVTRIVMNEEEDETHFFIHCSTCSNVGMINNFNNYGLFSQSIGRYKTSSFESAVPFTIRRVHYLDTDEYIDVKGIITMAIERQNKYFNLIRYLHVYGCTVTISITNAKEVFKVIPDYVPFNHGSAFTNVIGPAIRDEVANLMRHLDPVGGIDLDPEFVVAYDVNGPRFTSDNQSYTFRIILTFQKFNGVEIQNITPYNVIFKPEDDDFISGYLVENGPNQFLKDRISRMCTALLSDNGCLFVPEVLEFRTQYEGGKEFINASLRPRLVPFTDDGSINVYGDGNVNLESIFMNAFWLKSKCPDPLGRVEMVFPFFGNVDSNTMAYIRMPIGMPDTTYVEVAGMYTSSMISMDVCAEDSLYVYWRLYKEELNHFKYTDITRAIPDPFIKIDEDMSEELCHAAGENEDVIYNILMTLASSPNLNSVFDILDKRDDEFMKLNPDNLNDLQKMIQKVFSAYGTAINAGDDKEFLSIFGLSSGRAIRSIIQSSAEEMERRSATLQNVKDDVTAAAKSRSYVKHDDQEPIPREKVSDEVQRAIDDLNKSPQHLKKKKGFFGNLFG